MRYCENHIKYWFSLNFLNYTLLLTRNLLKIGLEVKLKLVKKLKKKRGSKDTAT